MSSVLLGKSPLRTIETSLGPLGAGSLGLVLARTGVGKTAFLVQIALDVLARDRGVLHFALGQTLDLVQSYYETLYEDLSTASGAGSSGSREAAWTELVRRRIIQAFAERSISADRVEKALDTFAHSLAFRPEVILIDGFDWSGAVASTAATIGAFKSFARRVGAELWMSAPMPRAAGAPTRLPVPCDGYAAIIDRALVLEPTGPDVSVRVVLERGVEGAEAEMRMPVVHLQPDTLRLAATEGEPAGGPRFPRSAYTLLSGAAQGAEAEFGTCAERHGIAEINFSFEGHAAARTRGLVQLSEQELRQGDVNSPKLTSHISRTYPGTPIFRKVLQSIWHQVHTAGEVFVVGSILPDDTIKGGTGWAAELAKHEQKPLRVYDQERHAWLYWHGQAFEPDPAPIITRTRFTGTGTRFLTDDGHAAVRGLFERSFGKPVAKS